jgi:hypothetical protein
MPSAVAIDPIAWGFTPKTIGSFGAEDSSFWRIRFGSSFGANQIELANVITVVTADEAAAAISEGYRRLEGKRPTAAILALLLAQWALETGNGKYVHNFNFGNVKRYGSTPYYQYFRCNEIIDGVTKWFDPPAPECAFAAYKNAADGAEAFVKTLRNRAHWWKGLQSGNIGTFNTALSTAPKYYTASPSLYLTGLQNRVDAYTAPAKKYGATAAGYAIQAAVGVALATATVYAFNQRYPQRLLIKVRHGK